MRRKTFDALLTAGGLVLAVLLLVAGGLLAWGHNFIDSQVHSQLAAQKIFFPAAGSEGLSAKEFPTLQQYGGKQLVDGEQARAYADQFIAVHIATIGGGKTYAQLSADSRANPTDAKAAAAVDTVFKGETLRGMLLNAYAFWKIGQIALFAAIAAFTGAAIMLVLSLLGMAHLRRTDPDAELGAPGAGSTWSAAKTEPKIEPKQAVTL